MYLIGLLSGDGLKLLSSFACGFCFLSSGGGMSGNDLSESVSSQSISSGSVLKSVINLFLIILKNVVLLY